MRLSPQRRLHLRAAGAVAALAGVLLLAVSVRMHAQRLVDDAGERLVDDAGERGSPALGSVALLGHVPECAADTHCRSACKMVCEEALSGTRAVRNHAATLISFGCCLSTPLIEKQVLGPSAAREVQLSEVPARGRKAETRLGYNPLADQHSLAANLRALEQDEGHQVHRLSHLRHAFQHDEEASRRRVGFLGLGAALPRGRAMRGTIMLKKEEEGPFTIERYKFNPWAREEVAENKSITDTDPNGVEHESEQVEGGEIHWAGKGHRHCEEGEEGEGCAFKVPAFQRNKRLQHALESVTATGDIARFRKPTIHYPEVDYDNHAKHEKETRIVGIGEPTTKWEEKWPGKFHKPRSAPDFAYQDPYLAYVNCLADEDADEEDCMDIINDNHEGFEWRRIPGCKAVAKPENATTLPPEFNSTSEVDPMDACVELVSSRILREAGEDAAHGLVNESDVVDGLAKPVPSDDSIRAFLGADLYKEYLQEEQDSNFYGAVHKRVAEGTHRARRSTAFRKAYSMSEFKWCLKTHKKDADFPKACTGGSKFAQQPFQSHTKPSTAPEKVFEGVLGAVSDLVIGEDRQEDVTPWTQMEKVGYGHKNKFENGAVVVQPGHVSGARTVAPWLRNQGLRDMPQSVESKEDLRRARAMLPGVNVDSWSGMPRINAEKEDAVAVTPSQCCHRYIQLSDY